MVHWVETKLSSVWCVCGGKLSPSGAAPNRKSLSRGIEKRFQVNNGMALRLKGVWTWQLWPSILLTRAFTHQINTHTHMHACSTKGLRRASSLSHVSSFYSVATKQRRDGDKLPKERKEAATKCEERTITCVKIFFPITPSCGAYDISYRMHWRGLLCPRLHLSVFVRVCLRRLEDSRGEARAIVFKRAYGFWHVSF